MTAKTTKIMNHKKRYCIDIDYIGVQSKNAVTA